MVAGGKLPIYVIDSPCRFLSQWFTGVGISHIAWFSSEVLYDFCTLGIMTWWMISHRLLLILSLCWREALMSGNRISHHSLQWSTLLHMSHLWAEAVRHFLAIIALIVLTVGMASYYSFDCWYGVLSNREWTHNFKGEGKYFLPKILWIFGRRR